MGFKPCSKNQQFPLHPFMSQHEFHPQPLEPPLRTVWHRQSNSDHISCTKSSVRTQASFPNEQYIAHSDISDPLNISHNSAFLCSAPPTASVRGLHVQHPKQYSLQFCCAVMSLWSLSTGFIWSREQLMQIPSMRLIHTHYTQPSPFNCPCLSTDLYWTPHSSSPLQHCFFFFASL